MSAEFERVITSKEALRERMVDAYRVAGAFIAEGKRVLVTVGEAADPITIKQRGFLHAAVLPQISEQVVIELDGKHIRYTLDLWKTYYWKLLVKPKYKMRRLPGARKATPYRTNTSSEHLGRKDYAKWIDGIIDHAIAEWHVDFVFKPEEREEVRYQPRGRKERNPTHNGQGEASLGAERPD